VGACASEGVTAISECDSETILSGLRFAWVFLTSQPVTNPPAFTEERRRLKASGKREALPMRAWYDSPMVNQSRSAIIIEISVLL
jgi:hypothetical protein